MAIKEAFLKGEEEDKYVLSEAEMLKVQIKFTFTMNDIFWADIMLKSKLSYFLN